MEGRLQRLEVQGLREQGSSSPRALSLPEERQNPMSAARSVADLVFLGHAGVGESLRSQPIDSCIAVGPRT